MTQDIHITLERQGTSLVTDMETFAVALKTWRIRHGLTQREMAQKAGVSRHTIMRAEAAKETINWQTIYKLFTLLANE